MTNYIAPPYNLKKNARGWSYLRDSGGVAQEQSVKQQRHELGIYCRGYQIDLAIIFDDEGKSGTSIIGRSSFERMIEMSNDPELRPDIILLWNYARFARNFDDTMFFLADLRRKGIIVHSITDYIPEGLEGRMMESMKAYANAEKSRQTSRDVKRGLQSLVQQGFSPGGVPPRGYVAERVVLGTKRDGSPRNVSRWVEDPAVWEQIKIAWSMRAEGASYSEIHKVTQGLIYKSKNCWATFFSNKAYLGIMQYGELEIPNHHPAAINLATWETVQSLRKKYARTPYRYTTALLSGLARCATCGGAMSHTTCGHNSWRGYICAKKQRQGKNACPSRRSNAKLAEKMILDKLLERVFTPDMTRELIAEVQAQFNDVGAIDQAIEQIDQEINQCNLKIAHLNDQIQNFGAARSTGEALRARENELDELAIKRSHFETKRAASEVRITPEALAAVLNSWIGELAKARQANDIVAMRRLLARFISRIDLGYNKISITYSYNLDDLTSCASDKP